MKNKVTSIIEKVPQVTPLPDGFYNGVWGGYFIKITTQGRHYELETETGVKGMGIKVVVHVENGVATFDVIND